MAVTATDRLLAGKDAQVQAIYNRLLEAVQAPGTFREEPKQTPIHLVNRTGLTSVHPREAF